MSQPYFTEYKPYTVQFRRHYLLWSIWDIYFDGTLIRSTSDHAAALDMVFLLNVAFREGHMQAQMEAMYGN